MSSRSLPSLLLLALPHLVAARPAALNVDVEIDVSLSVSSLETTESVLLFDAPGYLGNSCPATYYTTLQAYTYTNTDLQTVVDDFTDFLEGYSISVNSSQLEILNERSKFFATDAVAGETVEVAVEGCTSVVQVGATASGTDEDSDGQAVDSAALGVCGTEGAVVGAALLESGDDRLFTNTVYISGATGWGVISDIDDTIKITGSDLDAITNTLINPATPVSGTPALYATLSELVSPTFIYLTGSPWQLYGMLHEFIADYYTESAGPILLKNLTYTGVNGLVEFVAEGTSLEYKTGRIDEIHTWYPGKNFIGIGDSSAHDPESYAYAYRTYGEEWMKCIWIHLVDEGNNNTDARWAEAFSGIPEANWKLYTEPSELNPDALADGACW